MGGTLRRRKREDPTLDVPDPVSGLTPRQMILVKSHWAIVTTILTDVGVDIFVMLFTNYPDYQDLFYGIAGVHAAGLRTCTKLIAHADVFMYSITSIIDILQEPDVDLEILRKVGRSHAKRNLTRQHFENLKYVIVHILKERLKDKMDDKATEAWDKTLDFMFTGIYEGLEQGQI